MKGSDYSRVEKAIEFLVSHAEAQPSLAELAEVLGLSEFHCHRLFRRWAGLTPKDFIQLITLARAKRLLATQGSSLLETSERVGLSGSSRLHDLFVRYEAMTPGEYKSAGRALEIGWGVFDTPVGPMALGATARGICSLGFVAGEAEARAALENSWPEARLYKERRNLKGLAEAVSARMRGEKSAELPLLVRGTAFQVKVWEALLRVPEGRVTTYQELALLIGAPRAARAVGSAVGANPIGYLIPCHRVIRATGVVGDYHWGSTRKTALLTLERARGSLLLPAAAQGRK